MGCSPAKLEDDDEGDKVDETGPLWCVLIAAYTLIKDEGEGDHNTNRPCKTNKDQQHLGFYRKNNSASHHLVMVIMHARNKSTENNLINKYTNSSRIHNPSSNESTRTESEESALISKSH